MEQDRTFSQALEVFFSKTVLWLLVMAGVLLLVLIFKLSQTGAEVQRTSAYTRVSNCILAKNALGRTQQDVENCYKQVEQDTGITLKRFDQQVIEKK